MTEAELRSGITGPFNKRLNEALQFDPQMPFNIESTVSPSQLIAVLKGEQGTPGLPAAISAVKDNNNLIMLAVSPIERGELIIFQTTIAIPTVSTNRTTYTVPAGKKWVLKSAQILSSSLVATIGDAAVFLQVGLVQQAISITPTTGKAIYNATIPIVLSPGDKVLMETALSAYTSGTIGHKLTVQQIDI